MAVQHGQARSCRAWLSPMNYRHAFHAGNFADVLKHTVLSLVIGYLKQKPAAFRVIDTHAGVGLYDLDGPEASKTGEWRNGIARLQAAALDSSAAALLAPYFSCLTSLNSAGPLRRYPGSPVIAAQLLRSQDRLVANELHSEDSLALRRHLGRYRNAKVMDLDGWVVLKASLPPKERRAAIIIDPPFEQPGEFARLTSAAQMIQKRFRSGTALLWYPIKDQQQVTAFLEQLSADLSVDALCVELFVAKPEAGERVSATGLVVLTPTFPLHQQLSELLPLFVETMGRTRDARHRLFWLNNNTE
jgi:23S rRNA (adenine2030-N6)-methyltransferase